MINSLRCILPLIPSADPDAAPGYSSGNSGMFLAYCIRIFFCASDGIIATAYGADLLAAATIGFSHRLDPFEKNSH